MITYKQSESTYFQYQNALALVLSAVQLCNFKEEDSHEAERGHSGICASACIRRWALFRVHLTYDGVERRALGGALASQLLVRVAVNTKYMAM